MDIRVKITRDKTNRIITLDLEEYLYGVVSSEMSDTWPYEALKVQAICARTYAYRIIRARPTAAYHVDDTTAYQAYKIRDLKKIPNTIRAVKETAGMVLFYNNAPISAVYSASNGGRTVSAKERWGSNYPYLISKPDVWTKKSLYPKWGHGVGMSQRGAQWAANHGVAFDDILAFYYTGAVLMEKYGSVPVVKEPQRKVLDYGDTGDEVETLQDLLNKKGAKPKLKVDGIFGPKTKAAVIAFQKKNKLTADGIVGNRTWAKLLA